MHSSTTGRRGWQRGPERQQSGRRVVGPDFREAAGSQRPVQALKRTGNHLAEPGGFSVLSLRAVAMAARRSVQLVSGTVPACERRLDQLASPPEGANLLGGAGHWFVGGRGEARDDGDGVRTGDCTPPR